MLVYLVLILLASAWVLGGNARPKPALASPLQSMTCPQYCARFPVGFRAEVSFVSPCYRAGTKKGVSGCNCVCFVPVTSPNTCIPSSDATFTPAPCPPGELLEP
jgi:hypothetical protein